jgi:glycosyltransferase involved in cell wall biosynthesis
MLQATKDLLKSIGIDRQKIDLVYEKVLSNFRKADISIFHQFSPPPGGGGHQFLQALWKELTKRGIQVENNTVSRSTIACLCNSFNFDFDRLRSLKSSRCRIVHRVDGPIGVYRDSDEGIDQRIWQINQELADATIFQSQYSLEKHIELGLVFNSPTVIPNASDPLIFNKSGRIQFDRSRKIRLISVSWSDNLNKGAPVYKWLDDHLDWDRFNYMFVGRTPIPFKHVRTIPPVSLLELAEILRQSDIFVFASKHESCSNALIEALSCGLPAICIDSGSNAEIMKKAGYIFTSPEEIPGLLDSLIDDYESIKGKIKIPSLENITDRYLEVMGWNTNGKYD